MDNIFLPLVLCDLYCGLVLVHPWIELLNLPVLKLTLGCVISTINVLFVKRHTIWVL